MNIVMYMMPEILIMNDFTKEELTVYASKCPKCSSKMSETAAVFWAKDYSKIIETRSSCSNRTCDYVLVMKNE